MVTEFTFYYESAKVPDEYWDTDPTRILRSKKYFSAIEKVLSQQGIQSLYISFVDENNVPVLFQFHIYDMSLWVLLGGSNTPDTLLTKFGAMLLARPKLHLLICGNLLISGASGIWLNANKKNKNITLITANAIQFIKNKFKNKTGFILFKDLSDQETLLFDTSNTSSDNKYYLKLVSMAPIMELNIKADWSTLNDYANDLKSKYRTQYLDYRQKVQPLIKMPLSPERLNEYKVEINNYYAYIYNKAKTKGPFLGVNYFEYLIDLLPQNQFNLIGYFKENKLVAINSRFIHQKTVVSSFFGVTAESNKQYALFKNMLLDDLEYAIVNKAKLVNYGRTTYEVKSAIGAKPVTLNAAVIPLNIISRCLMPLVKIIFKQNPWHSRNPFR